MYLDLVQVKGYNSHQEMIWEKKKELFGTQVTP